MEQEERIPVEEMSNEEAAALLGEGDRYLRAIEEAFGVQVLARGNSLAVRGPDGPAQAARTVLSGLLSLYRSKNEVLPTDLDYLLQNSRKGREEGDTGFSRDVIYTTPRGKKIRARSRGQHLYLETIGRYDVTIGTGPAGTGKTYLAVVMAVRALKSKEKQRMILVRPAVEAGESLGFLPGDLKEKIDPYLRPIYDGLHDVLGAETAQKLIERQVIEIAPLAYMRGRTLDDAFIILDEAQNTTKEQMKMFLTRIGYNSKAVVTGDLTQIDLPAGKRSGLIHCRRVLAGIDGIAFCELGENDVVRHPLVKRIIRAYEEDTTADS